MTTTNTVESDLNAFGQAYGYDASYLIDLNRASPGAFEAFAASQPLGHYRSELSLEAHFVARITTMQAEDCGPCGQLNLLMAVEAGVDRELLEWLIHEPDRLPQELARVRAHVRQVLGQDPVDPEGVEALRASLGDAAFAELATAIVGSLIYPTLKRAMLASMSCEPLNLDF